MNFKPTWPAAPLAIRRSPPGRFVVLDFETTGLEPAYGATVIEVSAREVVNGEPGRELCTLIDPGCAVPPVITSITGITTAMVRGKPRAGEVMRELAAFVGDSHIVAHNASFDLKFLRHECARFNAALESERNVCTLLLARRIFPGRRSYRLGSISEELGLPLPQGMHRASADTFVTTLLFDKIYQQAVGLSRGIGLELTAFETLQRLTKRKVESWLASQGA
jgi:DNA polymerase-3 subunit epsilon